MLRGIVGDEAFFDGVRDYYSGHTNATALTPDFMSAMESASDQSLGWFFEQWLERPGHPELSYEWEWNAGEGVVTVSIQQLQERSWPAFRLPMEIEITTATGAQRHDVVVEGRSLQLRLPAPGAPTSVALDPDGWVLKRMR
jgi:aminopeptidase N